MNTTVNPTGTMPAYIIEGCRANGERVYFTERGTQAGHIVSNNWGQAERYGCPADAQRMRDKLVQRFRGIAWSVIETVAP